MDFSKLVARVRAILTAPKTEWPVIAGEPASVGGLYTGYIAWLAAIPPLFLFIKSSLIGYGAMGMHVRVGIGAGIGRMIVLYLLSLVMVYLVAWIINALAETFGGQKSQLQALKTIGYSYTAYWIAAIFQVVPGLGWFIILAGGIYGIYLLYLGLPHTMQCPPERAAGYTVVTVIATVVLGWILALVIGAVFGIGTGMHGGEAITSDHGVLGGAVAQWC